MKRNIIISLLLIIGLAPKGKAQINEDKLGAWYMYFYNTAFNKGPWGIQGDIQYRNFNSLGDLEQLLLRSGLTYKPENTNIKFTLGYGHITTGTYGDIDSTLQENRIYQEILYPVKFGKRFYTNHRFRYEQRFVENQDFRTRYRYNLFLNIPLNQTTMDKNTLYLALYNELFINGERNIGNNKKVEVFDRNRLYAALGFFIKKHLKVQFGVMNQTTNTIAKNQLQLSLHHNIQ
ncbi:MAG: DUF2490 domain-containing protein [Bacteroidia bacterium]|jgi:hypothetical protein|nr:DUF2490 domain-containing protein [Bacteroidia bacterium]